MPSIIIASEFSHQEALIQILCRNQNKDQKKVITLHTLLILTRDRFAGKNLARDCKRLMTPDLGTTNSMGQISPIKFYL